jgi:hypothetical protein
LYRKGSLKDKEKRLLDEMKSLIFSGKYTLNSNSNKYSCIIFIACHRPLGGDRLTVEAAADAAIAAPATTAAVVSLVAVFTFFQSLGLSGKFFHSYPFSTVQVELQPSPSITLPSSHVFDLLETM